MIVQEAEALQFRSGGIETLGTFRQLAAADDDERERPAHARLLGREAKLVEEHEPLDMRLLRFLELARFERQRRLERRRAA